MGYSPRGHKESDTTENLSTKSFGKVMYTLLYLKWITHKNLLYSTCNSTQCCVPAWMGGGFGGQWIHVFVRLSSLTVHLKLS